MHEAKAKNFYEDFSQNKEMFDFSNHPSKSKHDDDSNKVVVGKSKDETCVTIANFFVLKPKMCLFLLDDSSEHKTQKV